MDVLFTEKELATSCYAESQRTKKPGLDADKIALLEGNCSKLIMILKLKNSDNKSVIFYHII